VLVEVPLAQQVVQVVLVSYMLAVQLEVEVEVLVLWLEPMHSVEELEA
jgi:hypothetical protein